MTPRSRAERMENAHTKGRKWLDAMRRLEQRGINAGQEYDEADRKAHYWLNRYTGISNTLEL